MKNFKASMRENLLYILAAHMITLTTPAIVHAESGNYHPQNFTQPLKLKRGEISPIGLEGIYLTLEEQCLYNKNENGWTDAGCEQLDRMVFPGGDIDTVAISKPVSDGRVLLDAEEWSSSDIDDMTESLKTSLREQGQRVRRKIEFVGWVVYPKMNTAMAYQYYATRISWDGNPQISIKANVFDRYGYVPVQIIATAENLTESEIEALIGKFIAAYKPNNGGAYFESQDGDKIAAYGAMTVLAGAMGVKYGKAVGGAAAAGALIFLKKAAWLLLLPVYWLMGLFTRLFRRKGE
ncbi:hypothetical protein N182_35035 [Sinorhizobium sp. GL2]|nr:hypothetical protein N182_35035 [Sinorhizobium sp. GL2]